MKLDKSIKIILLKMANALSSEERYELYRYIADHYDTGDQYEEIITYMLQIL